LVTDPAGAGRRRTVLDVTGPEHLHAAFSRVLTDRRRLLRAVSGQM
jgi:hypothetical protein